jgi:hypothetical protein
LFNLNERITPRPYRRSLSFRTIESLKPKAVGGPRRMWFRQSLRVKVALGQVSDRAPHHEDGGYRQGPSGVGPIQGPLIPISRYRYLTKINNATMKEIQRIIPRLEGANSAQCHPMKVLDLYPPCFQGQAVPFLSSRTPLFGFWNWIFHIEARSDQQ